MDKFSNSQDILYAFETFEVKSGNEDELIIAGHISTTDKDKVNDIATKMCQSDMVTQLKTMSITMDLDHETWRKSDGSPADRPMNVIPVAKVTEAELTEKGTWVKAIINKSHPMYKSIAQSIKDGFLHSFSIAYTPVKAVTQVINGVKTRLLDKVNLLNVAITGSPINSNANFSIVTKSFIQTQMADDNEKQLLELKSQIEIKDKELAELKSQLSVKSNELVQVKSDLEAKTKADVEVKSQLAEIVTLKSQVSEVLGLKSEVAELKLFVEKVRTTPVFKAIVEAKSLTKEQINYNKSMLGYAQ